MPSPDLSRRLRAALLALGLALLPPAAEAQRDIRAFFFGNSLIHHLTETDETTVPYWLGHLARASGHGFAADGTWGFLQDFARDLPPEGKWSFAGVPRVMTGSFRMAGFDTIILNPPNFIQDRAPTEPLDGDNPRAETPVDLTVRTFDWAANQAPDARFFIYEGWSDMGGIGFPPRARPFRRWHAENAGAYHDWYVDYVAALSARLPDHDIRLIPAASVLAGLFTDGPLAELGPRDLYSDDAPHGTATTYYLAALVTHAVLHGEPPPVIDLPDTIHPLVRDAQAQVIAAIWAAVSGARIEASAPPPAAEGDPGPADPALAMGLNGISDWSTQMPFIDIMKTARPWIGHLPGQWGGMEAEAIAAGGHLTPEGWPRRIPDGVEAIEAFVLTDLPREAAHAAGRYRLTWAGQGALSVGGLARDVTRGPGNEITFAFSPGPGTVGIRVTATDPADPIRDIVLIRADHAALHALGEVFNPDWIRRVRDLRAIRFMDWMFTNGSPQVTWDDRPLTGDYSYHWRGVPVEVMVRLANEVGADPWFTLPHMADDAHVAAFAALVHRELDPRRHVIVEWSNEVWNFIFPQAHWAAEQAEARWGAGTDHWMQFAGLRAAEVADIWAAEFGADRDRLVTVVATHTGWPGLEEALLFAPRATAEGRPAPVDSFDAYAVTGYFGYELGEPDMAATLQQWADAGDRGIAAAAEVVRDGSLADLTDDLWPHHARVAADHGLRLMMYEGGTHVVGHGALTEDDALTDFYIALNYSPEMAGLYADLLTAWQALGGEAFNAFVDVAAPSRWGSWGAWRHLDDLNPRAATLMAWNATAGADWEDRGPDAFAHGALLRGSDGDDAITTGGFGDLVLAGAGGDVIAAGPGDRIHGGPGRDRVILPWDAAAVIEAWAGDALVLTGPAGAVRLVSVEEAQFADGATRQLMPEDAGR